ncbi:division/cell wall cluster transcriptional repressor MraZ [uncultured Desulfuromusa sp.]|uniref:division/cell wall cluster transcriptional repressor MraZ n=1 Tax=uncultured Desulfuromusa sp. TaxID=219183 RepID=UPI002AA92675|nr:division/cell wall cluster transcriptional repressor MraZ [uncultured Desulfuromusa sp.]
MKFSGEYNVSIDLKGRVSIPASFRDELRQEYGSEGLVVTRYKNGLVAYPPARWEEICANVFSMSPGPKREANIRNRIAPAKECSFNAQGRIQIPQSLREHAGLDKDVVVIGMFEKIEIWSQIAHTLIAAESESMLDEDAQGQADLGF